MLDSFRDETQPRGFQSLSLYKRQNTAVGKHADRNSRAVRMDLAMSVRGGEEAPEPAAHEHAGGGGKKKSSSRAHTPGVLWIPSWQAKDLYIPLGLSEAVNGHLNKTIDKHVTRWTSSQHT